LSIHLQQTKRAVAFLGENACHVALFVELSFSKLQNLDSSEPLPVRRSLPPDSKRELLTLEPIDPRKASNYEWTTSTFLGSSPPRPDLDYRYSFPFGGSQPCRLIQGVDGRVTHQGLHRFAYDFEMPIGTPVLAARDGIVLRVADGFPAGAFQDKYRYRSNAVFVLHPDGSIGDYGHLSAGIPVEEGARVEVGDLLGLSGNSGYTQGPHLHFSVSTQRPGAEGETIEIRFSGDVVPVEGGLYGPYPGGPDSTARSPL
jgi:murein DD-endopeptidase MepM/ murein hydrolase activator NlpD